MTGATGPSRARPVFLKLGGALMTVKDRRETVRTAVVARLVAEIADWLAASGTPLVLSHGSGSFAHAAVRETGFLDHPDPVATARVAAAARRLDARLVERLLEAGIPAVPLPGAALAVCAGGRVVDVRADLVTALLDAGLLPVVYGDACPDPVVGGAIASTEPILVALARHLPPARVVLATDVDGVYPVDPKRDPAARPLASVAPGDAVPALAGARAATGDVTGGMASKVRAMWELVIERPDVQVRIVSGLRPGAVRAALAGDPAAGGTLVVAAGRPRPRRTSSAGAPSSCA